MHHFIVKFKYGTCWLSHGIDRRHIDDDDNRGFHDLANLAYSLEMEKISKEKQIHVPVDFHIYEVLGTKEEPILKERCNFRSLYKY